MTAFRDQSGVAMVTVLLVGAVLTAVGTTAAFVSIQELRAGSGDRRGADALAVAEAGIDRMVLELKRGTYGWGTVRLAGCTDLNAAYKILVSGSLGDSRTYETELTVYNPAAATPAERFPPAACSGRLTSPKTAQYFAITSRGQRPTATRVVRQIVTIKALELPMGIYAENISANGNAVTSNVSMIAVNNLTGREKLGFKGTDPYYTKDDFYRNGDLAPMRAAAHAGGTIYFAQGGGSARQEHPPNPNCDANNTTGSNPGEVGQSLWDGSGKGGPVTTGCSGQTGFPPRSLFSAADLANVAPKPRLEEQDYVTMREAAKSDGIYCQPGGSGFVCTGKNGSTGIAGITVNPSDLGTLTLESDFIAYFDFPSGTDPFKNIVKWKAEIKYCSDDPTLNRSAVVIIRNGTLSMQSGAVITGAILVPEGAFESQGDYTSHGTIIAKEFRINGGANLEMSECWVRNIPGPFLDVTPFRWGEVDR